MKTVMAFGSFEVFHKGHEAYLKEAKSYGDFLTVVVSRDTNLQRIKGHEPYVGQEKRMDRVSKESYVDEVLLGGETDLLKVIEVEMPKVIVLGYDQQMDEKELKKELERRGLKDFEIKRAKAFKPEKYKSSLLK